ncbi:hypothetical protein APP_13600 [Aeribacillus pallidus]|nr:hypothetical protein APP_13600 [Aeribacillus pallidus]
MSNTCVKILSKFANLFTKIVESVIITECVSLDREIWKEDMRNGNGRRAAQRKAVHRNHNKKAKND